MPTFLQCQPLYFGIHYEINPWMNVQHKVDQPLAMQQWQQLYQIIKQCGGRIEEFSPAEGLPDLVFTANAALRSGKQIFLSHFRYPERQGELQHFKQWFSQAGFEIMAEPKEFFDHQGHYCGPNFEGAGDALFLGDILFSAYGFRTDKEIYSYIHNLLNIKKSVLCELVDPHFYHLDTCFCPLNDRQALWFPEAFSKDTQQRMLKVAELIAIPPEEKRNFACNAVVIDKNIIIPAQCPQTRTLLERLGWTVYDCPMTEFIKSGGACKCLTFDLG